MSFLSLKQILPSSRVSRDFVAKDNGFPKKLGEEFAPLPFFKTRVGIEVEAENIPLVSPVLVSHITSLAWWKHANDPSLRNAGLEFQSPGPIGDSKNVGLALAELREFFKYYKTADFSFRTGIHVHLCMMQFNLPQILNMLTSYCFVEPYLFEAFCPQRKFSNFCVPLSAGGPESGALGRMFRSLIEAHENERFVYDWTPDLLRVWPHLGSSSGSPNYVNKYSAINPSRIRDIGTLEFRHLPGSDDFILLRDWISTITSLADFAYAQKFENLSKQIYKATTLDKVKRIFNRIIPEEIRRDVPDVILLEGIRQTKVLLLGGKMKKDLPVQVKKTGNLFKVATEISKRRENRLKNYF